ncbi:hypothetical protein DFH08DRAFT_802883 [Mycena albidolilacea]|uniref:Uncharacterized protein n=1 Tax=Mycena albidolilacea TaxID=1033008 RepID=A0AAD7AF28_9AGAR|nr:hypothetical protein DFH08DRAFT_802883 [Mycena albidolilacea]
MSHLLRILGDGHQLGELNFEIWQFKPAQTEGSLVESAVGGRIKHGFPCTLQIQSRHIILDFDGFPSGFISLTSKMISYRSHMYHIYAGDLQDVSAPLADVSAHLQYSFLMVSTHLWGGI